jgi:hypothetical protein
VFFYGRLLPEFAPPAMRDVVGRSDFYDEGSVCGLLFNLGEYPGAVFDDRSGQRVYGAVFHLAEDSQVFEVLDRYEGYEPGGLTPGACSFASVITSTSRLGARLNAGSMNTMEVRKMPRSLLVGAIKAQVS